MDAADFVLDMVRALAAPVALVVSIRIVVFAALVISKRLRGESMIFEFTYNGTKRVVRVNKNTATYIQGENLLIDGVQPWYKPFSTYTKSKMLDVKVYTL